MGSLRKVLPIKHYQISKKFHLDCFTKVLSSCCLISFHVKMCMPIIAASGGGGWAPALCKEGVRQWAGQPQQAGERRRGQQPGTGEPPRLPHAGSCSCSCSCFLTFSFFLPLAPIPFLAQAGQTYASLQPQGQTGFEQNNYNSPQHMMTGQPPPSLPPPAPPPQADPTPWETPRTTKVTMTVPK